MRFRRQFAREDFRNIYGQYARISDCAVGHHVSVDDRDLFVSVLFVEEWRTPLSFLSQIELTAEQTEF